MRTVSLCSLLLALSLIAACNKPDSNPSSTATPGATTNGSLATAPVDYLNSAAKAEHSAIKSVDLSVLTEAIRRFQVEVGRFPRDLDELVSEKYIPRIPPVPYGSKLVYDSATGDVKVTSAQ
jgi:hypothetical protein